MRSLRLTLAAMLLLPISMWASNPAHAWGHLAHRMICAIALMQLTPDQRAEIDRLAARFKTPDGRSYRYFTQGCTFADTARGKARSGARGWSRYAIYNNWHFMNGPRSTRRISASLCHEDCVLYAIDYHFKNFANRDRTEADRAQALLMLSHFIGDAHQPLHIAFEDDYGGNRIKIQSSIYRSTNLHALWDTDILRTALGNDDWWDFARRLNEAISNESMLKWRTDQPIVWAQESYDITTNALTGYCDWQRKLIQTVCMSNGETLNIDNDYRRYAQTIVMKRIKQAGTRLAGYLIRSLD
ncbi:MAG: hypothetical protein DHS20C01_27450 [marine bacterium B5-7]|nr:MAG: hypothetical protein DHS20C01_27450 [marine bacterium B5-7]